MREETVYHEPLTGRVRLYRRGPVFLAYAGFVSRLMAMVVDLLVLFSTWLILGIATTFFVETSGITAILSFLRSHFDWITPLVEFIISAGFQLIALLTLGFVYFTFFYSFGGATLGKYLIGLRVVRTDGKRVRAPQAALRVVAYALSALPLYIGFLSMLVDDRRRAWHDRLARTVVVHSWQARPDETFLRELIDRVH